jgi:molecular chaperone GrpE
MVENKENSMVDFDPQNLEFETRNNEGSGSVLELEQKCAQLEDQLRRSVADYQNLLRRTQQEREQMRLYAAEPAVQALIPALDNFHYALKSFTNTTQSEQMLSSIKMIWNGLLSSLEQIGLKHIDPNGQIFDPLSHEVITQVPSDAPEGTIVEVFRPGYALRDRVLKPAQVAVASVKQ